MSFFNIRDCVGAKSGYKWGPGACEAKDGILLTYRKRTRIRARVLHSNKVNIKKGRQLITLTIMMGARHSVATCNMIHARQDLSDLIAANYFQREDLSVTNSNVLIARERIGT